MMRRTLPAVLFLLSTSCVATPARSVTPDFSGSRPAAAAAAGDAAGSAGAGLVDPKTGSLGYGYPFALPPGRDGMTPSLGLAYSSSSLAISDVGLGWTLTGTASIERDSRTATPAYNADDRYVYRTGNTRQTLVHVGPHTLGDEYRLFDDSNDLQFLLDVARNAWTVRARNGRSSTFNPAVVREGGNRLASLNDANDVFAWDLARESDANGNIIEYEYATTTGAGGAGAVSTLAQDRPRLVRVSWGGNSGATGAPVTPQLFHARLLRYPSAATSLYDAYRPPARDPSCATLGHKPNYRAGGRLDDSGEHQTVWGLAVEVTAPGTTDGTVRERVTRLQRFYRLTYNWDEGGCANTNELHQQLRFIEHRAADEAGQWTNAPTVSFEYNGFDRTFARSEHALPSSWRNYPANAATQYGFSRIVGNATGTVLAQALVDADSDGVVELVDAHPRFTGDLARVAVSPSGRPAVRFTWQNSGGFGAMSSSMEYDSLLTEDWSGLRFDPFPFSHSLSVTTSPETALLGFQYNADNSLRLDLDADGFADLLRWGGSAGEWTWHRSAAERTGPVRFETAQSVAALPWDLSLPYSWWQQSASQLSPPKRYSMSASRLWAFRGSYSNWFNVNSPNGAAIQLRDQVFGALLDVTGDGLPDRVVSAEDDKSEGSLLVYPATSPGVFGTPVRIWVPDSPEQVSLGLTPSRSFDFSYPSRSVDEPFEAWTFQSDRSIDLNGDGLMDFLTRNPGLEAYVQHLDGFETSAVYFLSLSEPVAYMNAGRAGLVATDALAAPRTLDITHLSDDKALRRGESAVHRGRVAMMDYNGDGFPDVIGAHDFWAQFNRGGRFMDSTVFNSSSLGLRDSDGASASTIYFGTESEGPHTMVVGKRVVVDVNGDGRPDLLSMIPASDRYLLFTDTDMSAAPGRIKAIVRGAARTEIRYQTARSAIQTSERALPAPSWVVESVTEKLSGQAERATRYGYGSGVMRRPAEMNAANAPVVPAARMLGYRRTAVCHANGTQTEFGFDYTGAREGLLVEHVFFGAAPGRMPSKCTFRSSELADYTRNTTRYTYIDTPRTLSGGEQLWTRRVQSVQRTTRDPVTGNQLGNETAYTYTAVNGRLVPATITARTLPGDDRTGVTTLQHAANTESSSNSYMVLESSRISSDASGRLLSRSETYYDGRTTLGAFNKGNATKQRTYLTSATYADSSVTLDAYGHVTRITSPTGKQSVMCWDRNALYPVQWQTPDLQQGAQVVDYATGQTLESVGPVGLPVTRLTCPAGAPSANFTSRVPPAVIPGPTLIKRFSATPLASSLTTPVPSYDPPVNTSTPIDPSKYDEHTLIAAGTRSYERAEGVAAASPYAALYGVSYGLPHAPTTSLTAAPVLSHSSSAYRVRMHYDGLGRVLKVMEPYERSTTFALGEHLRASYTRTATGEITAFIGATRNAATLDLTTAPQTRSAVDDWGRPTLTERAVAYSGASVTRWATTNFLYRTTGSLQAIEMPLANGQRGTVSATSWDDVERPTEIQTPAGFSRSASEGIETAGDGSLYRVVTRSDESGLVTREYYDAWGSLAAVSGGAAQQLTTFYSYDALGRVTRSMDPNGALLSTDYDLAGRVSETRRYGSALDETKNLPLSGTRFVYDADGRILSSSELDLTGTFRTTSYTYDASGRLASITPPVDAGRTNYGVTTYTYDSTADSAGLGRVRRVTSPTEDFDLLYDFRGRISSVQRTVHVSFPEASLSDSYTLAYEYDFADRTTRIYYRPQNTSTGQEISRIEYNPDGTLLRTIDETRMREIERVTQRNDASMVTGMSNSAGATVALEYAPTGGLLTQTVRHSAGTWSQAATRLPNGLISSLETTDTAGRAGVDKRAYTYDAVGRFAKVSRSIEGVMSEEKFEYDANRIRFVQQSQGHLSNSLQYLYASRDPSQLTELLRDGSTAQAFAYDALGVEQNATSPSSSSMTRDNDALGQVHRMGSTRIAPRMTGDVGFVYDAKNEKLYSPAGAWNFTYRRSGTTFVREKVTRVLGSAEVDLTSGVTRFIHRDMQGSPAWTYVAGTTPGFARIAYTEHGEPLLAQQDLPLLGFQGGLKDPNSERIFFGVRVYDPLTKRWTSRDPVRTNDPYQFNLDNPVAFADPSGRQPQATDNNMVASVVNTILPDGRPSREVTFGGAGELVTGHAPMAPTRVPTAPADANTRADRIEQWFMQNIPTERAGPHEPTPLFGSMIPIFGSLAEFREHVENGFDALGGGVHDRDEERAESEFAFAVVSGASVMMDVAVGIAPAARAVLRAEAGNIARSALVDELAEVLRLNDNGRGIRLSGSGSHTAVPDSTTQLSAQWLPPGARPLTSGRSQLVLHGENPTPLALPPQVAVEVRRVVTDVQQALAGNVEVRRVLERERHYHTLQGNLEGAVSVAPSGAASAGRLVFVPSTGPGGRVSYDIYYTATHNYSNLLRLR